MKLSTEIFTRQTNWLLGCQQEIKQKLLSTLSFMEQETLRSDQSLMELNETVQNLRQSSLRTRLLLDHYERELEMLLQEATFLDLMGENYTSDRNTLH